MCEKCLTGDLVKRKHWGNVVTRVCVHVCEAPHQEYVIIINTTAKQLLRRAGSRTAVSTPQISISTCQKKRLQHWDPSQGKV